MGFSGHSEKKYLENAYTHLSHVLLILFLLFGPGRTLRFLCLLLLESFARLPLEKPTEGNEGNEESKDRCFGVPEEFCRAPVGDLPLRYCFSGAATIV